MHREKDYVALPDGSALVTRKTCACGISVTLFRGVWWNNDDTPHDCDSKEENDHE